MLRVLCNEADCDEDSARAAAVAAATVTRACELAATIRAVPRDRRRCAMLAMETRKRNREGRRKEQGREAMSREGKRRKGRGEVQQ